MLTLAWTNQPLWTILSAASESAVSKDKSGIWALHGHGQTKLRYLNGRPQQLLTGVKLRTHTSSLHILPRRQIYKQRLLIPNNVRSLIQPALRSAIRELHIEVPEKVRDDQAHFVVGEAKILH
jgi:hypothetical protein